MVLSTDKTRFKRAPRGGASVEKVVTGRKGHATTSDGTAGNFYLSSLSIHEKDSQLFLKPKEIEGQVKNEVLDDGKK